jgi:hypothetical protein
MHHRRIHNKNREIIVNSAKEKFLARRLGIKKPVESPRKWRDRVDIKDRGLKIRGLIEARKTRARSRWVSVVS